MHALLVTTQRGPGAAPAPLIDPLTGTLARPALLAQLAALKAEADRRIAPFAACLVDVDHLKTVNEQWGQQQGDAVIAGVTTRIAELIGQPAQAPRAHVIGRYDGDGILLASPAAEPRAAALLAEQIRAAVGAQRLPGGLRITVSLGVALYRIGEPLDELLARTEKALHVAKQFGRDCVEIAGAPPVRSPIADVRVLAV